MSITTKFDFIQNTLNNVEIHGLIAMFNSFYGDYLEGKGIEPKGPYGFFYCNDYLCSEDDANGTPIKFEGYKISYLAKRTDGDLTYMILEDKKEKEFVCEFNMYNGQWYILNTEKSGKAWK